MASQMVMKFAQWLETDTAARAKIDALKADDKKAALAEVARIAGEAGFPVTPAELEDGYRQLASGELRESALDAVVGGTGGAFRAGASSSFTVSMSRLIIPGAGVGPCN